MSQTILTCQQCSLAAICLPVGLNTEEMRSLTESVSKQNYYERGSYLARRGEKINHLYAVKTGSFKAVALDGQENQRIIDFHLPGELIGLDCIADNTLAYDIIALESSSVCEVSTQKLFDFAATSKNLQKHLFTVMSKRLAASQRFNANATAEERIVTFLLAISARHKNRGLSATRFNLSMSRQDIGDFLGLATETVSRTLQKFHDAGLIKVERRGIELLDLEKINSIGNCNYL